MTSSYRTRALEAARNMMRVEAAGSAAGTTWAQTNLEVARAATHDEIRRQAYIASVAYEPEGSDDLAFLRRRYEDHFRYGADWVRHSYRVS